MRAGEILDEALDQFGPVSGRFQLEIDGERGGDGPQDVGEEGNALADKLRMEPATGVEVPQVRVVVRGEHSVKVRGAPEPLVMKHHETPVAGHLHIELDHVGARIRRDHHRGYGILRRARGRAAVSDHGDLLWSGSNNGPNLAVVVPDLRTLRRVRIH